MGFTTGTKAAGANSISGPGTSTDNAVVLFNGPGGDALKGCPVLIDSSGNITGVNSLTVNTLVAMTTIETGDNTIVLNSEVFGSPSIDAGLEVKRGIQAHASLIWHESSATWRVGLLGSEQEIVAGTASAATSTAGTFTAGVGAAAKADSTFDGGSGTAYSVQDIVKALKQFKILAD